MGLFKILQKNFEKFPDKTALIIENKKYSYKEFFELTVNTINNLKINNFKKESKVIIIEDNSLTHVLSIFALSYINSTIVPTGKYYSNNHLLEIAKITKVNGIIANSRYCNYFKKKINLKSYLCINKSKKFPYFCDFSYF